MKHSETQKLIGRIISQYDRRIDSILDGRVYYEISPEEKEQIDTLQRSATFDPRRPDVGYGTREMAENGIEIAKKLNAFSEEEFNGNPYVLQWIYEIGDGFKVTNLPIHDSQDA